MDLDLFSNLKNSTKENNIIQDFIKELSEFLDNNERKQDTLIQEILNGRALTTSYRDKINVERSNIITTYSKENSEQGEFYYVYSRGNDSTYGVVKYKNEESSEDIWVKESQLPKGAGIDSVLREENGKFLLDEKVTEEIQEKLAKMINRLLEEQANEIEAQRVEGHIYEIVDKAGNVVELTDITKDTGECFEEIAFSSELMNKVTQGDICQYVKGEYQLINN